MKTLLSIAGVFSGFLLALGMFAAGLAFTAYFIAIEPGPRAGPTADVADLWTAEPRRVDKAAQSLERVAALPPSAAAPPVPEAKTVDTVATGSITPPPSDDGASEQVSALHAKWCAERYRSWRPNDNKYTSFSGEQRPCVSPFMNGETEIAGNAPVADQASAAQGEVVQEETLIETFQEEPLHGGILPEGDQAQIVEELPALVEEIEMLPAPAEETSLQYALDAEAGGWVDQDHASYCFSRYRSYRPEDNSYQPFGGGPRLQCE